MSDAQSQWKETKTRANTKNAQEKNKINIKIIRNKLFSGEKNVSTNFKGQTVKSIKRFEIKKGRKGSGREGKAVSQAIEENWVDVVVVWWNKSVSISVNVAVFISCI